MVLSQERGTRGPELQWEPVLLTDAFTQVEGLVLGEVAVIRTEPTCRLLAKPMAILSQLSIDSPVRPLDREGGTEVPTRRDRTA